MATRPQINAGGAKTRSTANKPKYPAAMAQMERPTGRSSRTPASCPMGLLVAGNGGGAELICCSKPDRTLHVNLPGKNVTSDRRILRFLRLFAFHFADQAKNPKQGDHRDDAEHAIDEAPIDRNVPYLGGR